MSKRIVLMAAWPLFAGLTVIMIGNGLQSTVLGLRASLEHFSEFSIGAILSMYYIGFLSGSIIIPKWVANVGHIRVFTAMTAIASTTVLAHGVFVTPFVWMLARAATGFAFAGLYIVIESWINGLANRKTRGSILGIYLVIHYIALAVGQLCLYITPPENINPFILISVLVSISALPIALSRKPGPVYEEPEKLGAMALWRVSPLSFYAVGMSGFCCAVLFMIAPVYGAAIGMTTSQIANFMAIFIVGGIFGQMPLGILSDRIGRRKTIIGVTAATAAIAALCFLSSGTPWLLNVFFFFLGFTTLTIYALGSALAIDYLEPSQYVSAAGTLLLVNGGAAIAGPIFVSTLLGISPHLFFPVLAVSYLSITVFGLYRSTQRDAMSTDDQEGFVAAAAATGATQIATQMAVEVAGEGSLTELKRSENDA